MPSRKSVAVSESSDASRQSVSRKAGTGDKEPVGLVEKEGEGREGERSERTARKGGFSRGTVRVVPAWLPSLEWWAIAAMRAPMRSSDGAGKGRSRVVCADRMPTMHSLYLSLPYYASTVALSRIPKVGLARGQVGSRFCRTPYISPRDGPARENQPISPPPSSRLLRPFSWHSLLCSADLS